MNNNDEIERKRMELEISIANEQQMSDTCKSRLIRKLLDLIEEELNEQD